MHCEHVHGHPAQGDRHGDAGLIGAHVEGQQDEEEASDKEDDRKYHAHFDGPLEVGLLVAQPEKGADGCGHGERLDEGGVVDEHVNLRRRQIQERQDALHKEEADVISDR